MIKSNPIPAREGEVWTLKLGRSIDASPPHPVWVTDVLQSLAGRRAKKLVVDLAEAGPLDAQGLRHLLTLHERLERESVQLVLLNPCPQFYRILQIMQLHHIFVIEFDKGLLETAPPIRRKRAASQTHAGSRNRC